MYITLANIGPFVEKLDLSELDANIPETLSYHIVGVSSCHKVK